MTGSGINESKYSVFTLSFLDDSGWYEPNYNLADKFTWGLGEGCRFIREQCHDKAKAFTREFCYNT